MKKLVLTLLVVAMAIPAFAADISITTEGVIQLTTEAGEDVRGLAIIVGSENPITAITAVNPEFNVNMDAAFEAADYAIGAGLELAADPAGPGTIALPAAEISICLGKLDELGAQAALPTGTIDVATIATSGMVTITADALRGGIVGDAVIAGTIEGGPVGGVCVGDLVGDWGMAGTNGVVDMFDLTDFIAYLSSSPNLTGFYEMPATGKYVSVDLVGDWGMAGTNGVVDMFDLTDFIAFLSTSPNTTGFYEMPCMP